MSQPPKVENARKPGVCYAPTDEGVELPVIDVTHPAFRVDLTREQVGAALKRHVGMMRRSWWVPGFLRALQLRLLQRSSVLLRGIRQADGGFLSGMHTYLLKLGPDNLGPGFSSRIDRKVADSFPALAARIRLQEAARTLAQGLAPALTARPGAPLHFVNIAGGPASDSLNALILLRQEDPECLEGRSIHIHVLDLHKEAPAFGARALAALQAEGGPLRGLTVAFQHRTYDWSNPRGLGETLAGLEPGAVVAVSSEGGLFNYGSDEDIRANLEALLDTTPGDSFVVGSLSWDSALAKESRRFSRIGSRDFSPDGFDQLVTSAGWKREPDPPGLTRQIIRLTKAAGR